MVGRIRSRGAIEMALVAVAVASLILAQAWAAAPESAAEDAAAAHPRTADLTTSGEPASGSVASKTAPTKPADRVPLEFFQALAQHQIDATVIPRDARSLVLQITNQTDQPLVIHAPRAIAAVPVLAQALPRANQNKNVFGKQDAAPQKVGAQMNFGFQGQNNGLNNGRNAGPQNRLANPLFNIPPEKTLRVSVPCVCLEYAKPNPGPHIPYQLAPLETVNDQDEVREIIDCINTGRYTQKIAQIAAWHFTNQLSWEQLAALTTTHANHTHEAVFTAREIELAKDLVADLPSTRVQAAEKAAAPQ
ncbi:MAG TPA: hypothetical protein VFE24_05055 [Pirellulales bacterium]|jgi:hypothetical protein|nr:hypothetical protein [Pirellulales bacterium]